MFGRRIHWRRKSYQVFLIVPIKENNKLFDTILFILLRCILTDSGKKYTLKDFAQLLETDLFFNVERNSSWGSYRHLPINVKTVSNIQTTDAKVSVQTKGDLTTLQWVESSK